MNYKEVINKRLNLFQKAVDPKLEKVVNQGTDKLLKEQDEQKTLEKNMDDATDKMLYKSKVRSLGTPSGGHIGGPEGNPMGSGRNPRFK
jgi:hypothetical protein